MRKGDRHNATTPNGLLFVQVLFKAMGRSKWVGLWDACKWLESKLGNTSARQIRRWANGESLPSRPKFERLLEILRRKGITDTALSEVQSVFKKLRSEVAPGKSRIMIRIAGLPSGKMDIRVRMLGPPDGLNELREALDVVLAKLRVPPSQK